MNHTLLLLSFWFFLSIKYFLAIQLRRRAGQLWTGTGRGRMGLRHPEGSKAVSTPHQDLLQPREAVGGRGQVGVGGARVLPFLKSSEAL